MEVVNGVARTGFSLEEFLDRGEGGGRRLAAGHGRRDPSTTTSAGCCFSPRASRRRRSGIEVVQTAHRVGIPTTATMMYGHVDAPHHWVAPPCCSRGCRRSPAFHRVRAAAARPPQRADLPRRRRAHRTDCARQPCGASRWLWLLLDGRIANIQCARVGSATRAAAPCSPGSQRPRRDATEETISRMAGSEFGSAKTRRRSPPVAAGAGRPVRQRTTTVGEVPRNGSQRPRPGGLRRRPALVCFLRTPRTTGLV